MFSPRSRIERLGLTTALGADPEQPCYPFLIWSVWNALVGLGLLDRSAWATSAQIAAATPLALAVAPVYIFFRRWLGSTSAFAGALLFLGTRAFCRLGADGLSDGPHLFFFSCALWAATEALARDERARDPSQGWGAVWSLACGLLTAIAILTRVESIVIPPAFCVVVACRSKRRFRSLLAFGLGCALGLAPYLAISQARRPSEFVQRLLGGQRADETTPFNQLDGESTAETEISRNVAFAVDPEMSFARKDPSRRIRRTGLAAAAWETLDEGVRSLQVWIGLLAVFGAWRVGRGWTAPLSRFFAAIVVVSLGAVLFQGARVGFVSSRHVLPLSIPLLGLAGFGAMSLGESLAVFGSPADRWKENPGTTSQAPWRHRVALGLLTCALALGLISPLHETHAGHRRAAEWLAAHAKEADHVLDTRGWTALYTGLTTYRYELAKEAFADGRLAYLILESDELSTGSPRARTLSLLLSRAGETAAVFPTGRAKDGKSVLVFRWRGPRLAAEERNSHAT